MRKRLFQIIEVGEENDKLSRAYDFFMMATIIISIIPLWSHEDTLIFNIIDKITVVIFIIVLIYVIKAIIRNLRFNPEEVSIL